MSDTQDPMSIEERRAVFAAWLKPMPTRITIMDRIAPWRHQFAKANAAGYTWDQLAKEIATKPEIGVQITGNHLKKCVHLAFRAANERSPNAAKRKRRPRAKPSVVAEPIKPTEPTADTESKPGQA